MKHTLKTWTPYFSAIWNGHKNFEVRKDDRNFCAGDTLSLVEWDKENDHATGRILLATISFVLMGGQFGIEPGYCVLALKDIHQ